MSVNEPWPKVRIMYVGCYVSDKDMLCFRYIRIDVWNEKVPHRAAPGINFGKKNPIKIAMVGDIFEVEANCTDDNITSIRGATASFKERYHDNELILELSMLSRAAETEYKIITMQKSKKRNKVDLEALEPVCKAYYNAGISQRAAILAEFVKTIITWRPR